MDYIALQEKPGPLTINFVAGMLILALYLAPSRVWVLVGQ